jgi:hypothetical protein
LRFPRERTTHGKALFLKERRSNRTIRSNPIGAADGAATIDSSTLPCNRPKGSPERVKTLELRSEFPNRLGERIGDYALIDDAQEIVTPMNCR